MSFKRFAIILSISMLGTWLYLSFVSKWLAPKA